MQPSTTTTAPSTDGVRRSPAGRAHRYVVSTVRTQMPKPMPRTAAAPLSRAGSTANSTGVCRSGIAARRYTAPATYGTRNTYPSKRPVQSQPAPGSTAPRSVTPRAPRNVRARRNRLVRGARWDDWVRPGATCMTEAWRIRGRDARDCRPGRGGTVRRPMLAPPSTGRDGPQVLPRAGWCRPTRPLTTMSRTSVRPVAPASVPSDPRAWEVHVDQRLGVHGLGCVPDHVVVLPLLHLDLVAHLGLRRRLPQR